MKRHSNWFGGKIDNFRRLPRTKKILIVGGITLGILLILAFLTAIFFATTLSSKERILNRNDTGVTLLDRNGKEFYKFNNPRSDTYVELEQIAPITRQAIVASEDKGFYEHPGFSVQGIAGAVYENLRPGGLDSGGSTITQQLVKNALLTQDRNFMRKYQELVLSVEIERQYSKQEILEMYLNSVYFGEGYFGIEDAAQGYFGVAAKDLNLAQSAMLVGLLPAPAAYSPISGDKEKAGQRQEYVLGRMQEDGYIRPQQASTSLASALQYRRQTEDDNFKAPHFALMVKEELEEKYGEEEVARSGFLVTTTLDLNQQTSVERAVSEHVGSLSSANVSNGAAVVSDPRNGEIRALAGSIDYDNEKFGKVNMATSPRQPGSSFKPFVYATGIEEEVLTAATILNDKPTDFGGGYKPENYDLGYRGDVTVRRALANSLNIPAVQAMQQTGVQDVVDQVERMGVTTLEDNVADEYGLSLALGAGSVRLTDLTGAYGAFANQGNLNELHTIKSITNKYKDKVFTANPSEKSVISPEAAYVVSSMLSDSRARAETFGDSLSVPGHTVAVKTGTTEDYRDSLTVGYTPSLAVGVWVGNNDNTPTSRVAGSAGAGPIWQRLMSDYLANVPDEQFEQPEGIEASQVCTGTGAVAENQGGNTYTEYFVRGSLPNDRCNTDEDQERREEAERKRREASEAEEARREAEEAEQEQLEEEAEEPVVTPEEPAPSEEEPLPQPTAPGDGTGEGTGGSTEPNAQ